jgi:hypothetical protein
MRHSERGFTYPLLLMMIVLLNLFFTFQMQFYLSEKRLSHETVAILKQEYYMHIAVKKLEDLLQGNLLPLGTGKLLFSSGVANYRVESFSSTTYKITISLKLNTIVEIFGYAYYDRNQKKMIKWVERN